LQSLAWARLFQLSQEPGCLIWGTNQAQNESVADWFAITAHDAIVTILIGLQLDYIVVHA
jgi:hypothetical protein